MQSPRWNPKGVAVYKFEPVALVTPKICGYCGYSHVSTTTAWVICVQGYAHFHCHCGGTSTTAISNVIEQREAA